MDLAMAYQPIVTQLPDAAPVLSGYEALWRPPGETPDTAWARLKRAGETAVTDVACIAAAWAQRPAAVSPRCPLHLNVFPKTLAHAGFWRGLDGLDADPVVMEIVETPWTPDTPAQVDRLRRRGFRVALDDLDPDPRWLPLLDQARPAVLKLRRGFLATASGRRRLPELTAWARTHNARVIAEGVETADDVAAYHAFGVWDFQGFFFARPLRFVLSGAVGP